MTNKEIADAFNSLAKLMELHKENPYKIRSYQNAYIQLRKVGQPLEEMSDEEINNIKGVGKAIASKIREFIDTSKLSTMQQYIDKTPIGVQEMLSIKGFGPKKIQVIWKELGTESIGELLYACNENRLVELRGFGPKTQLDLKKKLEYFQQSKGKFHYARLEGEAIQLKEQFEEVLPNVEISFVGALRRKVPILESIDFLIATRESLEAVFDKLKLDIQSRTETKIHLRSKNNTPITIYLCDPKSFGSKLFRYTGNDLFMDAFLKNTKATNFKGIEKEEEVFEKAGIQFIPPALREGEERIKMALKNSIPTLIQDADIKGVIHTHTTYSDGLHTLEEMVTFAKEEGYDYIGITDHSKSAFYASGLKVDRVLEQMKAIDELNNKLTPFRIFKGIESDILNDGSLDYEEDILKQFDFIIASIHSNLKMDKEKATKRLITAIENPYTKILGHPTGRLLLSREAYPIDHKKVIDACAANKVAIELNANPHRLDIDWTWILYALEKGVLISINPDAHSKEGIYDIHFGVCAAQKGGLSAAYCLNTFSVSDFEAFISDRT